MRLLVAAGASGGGVYPALAVLQELGDEDLELLWVGGEGGMEEDLVTRAGYQLRSLPAAGLHLVGLSRLPRNFWLLTRGYFAARRLLAEFRPDVLFFTGGFVAAPVALAGRRVPTLVFVPDLQPGLTLRMIARFADVVAIVAEEARQYFRRPERAEVTGYPLRNELTRWSRAEAMNHFGLSKDQPTLLVFGGSKGARSINQAVLAVLPALLEKMQVVHITGEASWAEVNAAASKLPAGPAGRYHAFPYLHGDMGAAFAAADLTLCRAGASTLGELPCFKLPAVLVPIPLRGHLQHVNAAYLQERGAALILADEKMKDSLTATVIELIQNKPRLQQMGAAMAALSRPKAAAQIAEMLRKLGARTGTAGQRSEA
ncbi:MAG TPA: undecaprenyldiphospho-muramoylpentapeptide beta-N-acetylglucosaminyltransferase [Anaerolineales bacterium]|nr:undecaprenyldiphospho-muramoylpentapeptide beta-N-acetylglucosaminyltransferase [Anaerolineales bacterium]